MRNIDNGGGCAYMGVGIHGKSLSSSQFCCETKTTVKKKNKSFFKKQTLVCRICWFQGIKTTTMSDFEQPVYEA